MSPTRAMNIRWASAAALMLAAATSQALPGDLGKGLIDSLGKPANDYQEPPQPTAEDFRQGKDKLATVYWTRVQYDPFRTGLKLKGNLVVTFQYPRNADRMRADGRAIGWADLTSYSEVFLSQVSPDDWNATLQALGQNWVLERQEERTAQGNAYTLYTLVSEDGARKVQISYSPNRQPAAVPSKIPVFNFWSRIGPTDDVDWNGASFGQ